MSAPRSRLLSLPAELRNEILRMVLPHDEVIEIPKRFVQGGRNGWPSIVDVCKQLRGEALPVLFADNTFQISFANEFIPRDEGLTPWLEKVKTLPFASKRLVKSLKTDFGIEMMDWCEFLDHEDEDWVQPRLYFSPRYDACDRFLRNMAEAGLMAHQLIWPRPVGDSLESSLDYYEDFSLSLGWAEWKGGYLFNKYVLSPLLRRHGLHNEGNPPVDVRLEFEKQCDELDIVDVPDCYFDLRGIDWNGHHPSDWYWAWVAEKEGLPEGEELFCDWSGVDWGPEVHREHAEKHEPWDNECWEDEIEEGESDEGDVGNDLGQGEVKESGFAERRLEEMTSHTSADCDGPDGTPGGGSSIPRTMQPRELRARDAEDGTRVRKISPRSGWCTLS